MRIIDDISNFIFVEDKPQKADIIFIPGGSYAEISEEAAKLWHQRYSDLILPSGKYSVKRGYFPGPLSKGDIYNKKYNTEWEFLKDALIQNGVDEKSVLREDNSQYTYQNALFSKEVTDKYNLNIKKAIICCKSFHARRCLMYYQIAYPQTEFIVCPSNIKGINKESWFKTEEGIDKVMGELMRCGSQFKEVFGAGLLAL
ncbi:YdcF family protein [Clostridium swellfunianum]|uniref:YdcF family protein n=1 Tax=Clostridium swellfunianum TaxID=1367462 RepID=UPI00202F8FA1|nr:YdcF family protein [Clostridium swellfunianum]MCM0648867.1 YdcF family protein [Clostridium swellfunianum]